MPLGAGWRAPKPRRFSNSGSQLDTRSRCRIVSAQVRNTPDCSSFFLLPGRMDMTGFARRLGIGLLASALGCGIAIAQGWQHIGKVQRVEKLKDGIELTAGASKVRVTVFREGIFRVRVAPGGTFPKDSSWALIESPAPPPFKIEENRTEQRIISGNVTRS